MLRQHPIQIGIKIKPFSSLSTYTISPTSNNKQTFKFNSSKRKNESITTNADFIHDANQIQQNKSAFFSFQMSKFVEKFCQGYNATVIAYGQTGSGKTYLMEGSDQIQKSCQQKGLIEQTINQIYSEQIQNCLISCSFIQIYNEKIYDLSSDSKMQNPLRLRWEPQKQFILQDLQPKVCYNQQQMLQQYKNGRSNRILASNRINQLSSRSHCLFTIYLQDVDSQGYFRSRQLTFVDLAGSERLSGSQLKLSKQSIQINKSLFFLRKVIKQLQQQIQKKTNNIFHWRDDKKQIFIPYRNSKLTSLLKRALGGNCLTLMIACISPQEKNYEQTFSSLSYVVSAGNIKNQASIQYDKKSSEIKYLKEYNMKLKKQLEISRKQIGSFQNLFKSQHQSKNKQLSSQLVECISTVRQLLKTNKQIREELEFQKNKNKSHLKQITQLVRINRDYKNSMRKNSIENFNQKTKDKIHCLQLKKGTLYIKQQVPRKFSIRQSPYISSPSKTQPSNSLYQDEKMNKTQSFRSVGNIRIRNKLKQSIVRRHQFKLVDDLSDSNIKLNPIKVQKKKQK